jgi:hypothetical protein
MGEGPPILTVRARVRGRGGRGAAPCRGRLARRARLLFGWLALAVGAALGSRALVIGIPVVVFVVGLVVLGAGSLLVERRDLQTP